MIGGGLKLQKIFKEPKFDSLFNISIIIILLLLIRAYIVQITYNMIWPKIVKNTGGDDSNFKPISFYESIMIVLLFSFLFRM